MKTIAIVVGANGFLGSQIVHKLINNNVEVWAVYNKRSNNINPKATIMNNNDVLAQPLQPNYIYFASGNYTNSNQELIHINENLNRYVQQFPAAKFVYISSTNVYGLHDGVIDENTCFCNPSLYGLSKIAGEFIIKTTQNHAILRLTYLYGKGISNTSFIPQILTDAKNNGQIKLNGAGNRKQDYLYIDDAADFCITAAQATQNGIYLGATGVAITNKEVATEIAKHINCKLVFEGEESGQSFVFNPQLTKQLLQWTPTVSIAEGIKKMITE
jgi:UDP-glucose 4-epimerase